MNETIVSMQGINKSFPGVKALDNVHFELRSGEVMALLGENGAGKSTLMKILSGVYTRDSGTVEIFGKECGDLNTKQAQALGVAIIHQELNMCPHLTVAENMFLGREKRKGFMVDTKAMEAEAAHILSDLKIDISPSEMVGNLPVSKQQMVEIAKALSINAKILIMDEPTSALTAKEIDELFRIIKRLRADGCGIVYISHRLEELQHIVDRVTIMRDGQYITNMEFAGTPMDTIITHMVGREIKEKFRRVECQKGEKIFEVKNLNAGKLVRDSRVVIFDEPTRGIDVAAKVEIYNLMNQLKQQGVAVMFVSSEMPEVMGIADRIIVMCDGRITGEVMAREPTQAEILTLATKFENKFAEEAV